MSIQRTFDNNRMSMIVRDGSTVYLSGQTAADPGTSAHDQTVACLAKIDALLSEAGSSRSHLLSVLIHLKEGTDFADMNAAWDEWIADVPKPARTCVIAGFPRPEVLVEITVVAKAVSAEHE
jgi:enamine deaminase RidA (YjgF/YER057c/UK114 family)